MHEMWYGKESLRKICVHVCESVSDKDKEREESVFSYADPFKSAPSD